MSSESETFDNDEFILVQDDFESVKIGKKDALQYVHVIRSAFGNNFSESKSKVFKVPSFSPIQLKILSEFLKESTFSYKYPSHELLDTLQFADYLFMPDLLNYINTKLLSALRIEEIPVDICLFSTKLQQLITIYKFKLFSAHFIEYIHQEPSISCHICESCLNEEKHALVSSFYLSKFIYDPDCKIQSALNLSTIERKANLPKLLLTSDRIFHVIDCISKRITSYKFRNNGRYFVKINPLQTPENCNLCYVSFYDREESILKTILWNRFVRIADLKMSFTNPDFLQLTDLKIFVKDDDLYVTEALSDLKNGSKIIIHKFVYQSHSWLVYGSVRLTNFFSMDIRYLQYCNFVDDDENLVMFFLFTKSQSTTVCGDMGSEKIFIKLSAKPDRSNQEFSVKFCRLPSFNLSQCELYLVYTRNLNSEAKSSQYIFPGRLCYRTRSFSKHFYNVKLDVWQDWRSYTRKGQSGKSRAIFGVPQKFLFSSGVISKTRLKFLPDVRDPAFPHVNSYYASYSRCNDWINLFEISPNIVRIYHFDEYFNQNGYLRANSLREFKPIMELKLKAKMNSEIAIFMGNYFDYLKKVDLDLLLSERF